MPAAKDSEWTHTAILDAIKALPNLQTLYIELYRCQIEIPFHFFTALRRIFIYDVGEERKSFENLIKMISQSPLLESIDLSCSYVDRRRGISSTKSLHQLFESYPNDKDGSIPPLRLKHLSLARCFVCLDDETVMRHLRYLTSLSLYALMEPISTHNLHSGYSENDDIDNDLLEPSSPHSFDSRYSDDANTNTNDIISEDDWEIQSRWGSSCEQIWRTICNADLRLEEIALDTITSAFLEYIGSYSGLKKLKISTGGFEDWIESDSAAKIFYKAVEMHAGSIEELDIDAYYQGLWCFGHHNKALFPIFQNLTTLGVKVQSSEFVEGSDSEPGDVSDQDIIVSSFGPPPVRQLD